jgi:hypothetical protein
MMNGVLGAPTTTTRTLDRKRVMLRMDDEAATAAPEAATVSSSTMLPRRVSLDETHLQPDVLAKLIIPSSTSSDDNDEDDHQDEELEEDEEEDGILSWFGSRTKRQRRLVPPQELPPAKVVSPPVPDEEAVLQTEKTPKKKHDESSRTTTTTNSCRIVSIGGNNNNAQHHHHHQVGADEDNYYSNKNNGKSATQLVVVANDDYNDDYNDDQKKTKAAKLLRFVARPTLVGRAAAVDDPDAVWYSRSELVALRNDCRTALWRHGGPKVAAEILHWYNNNEENGDEDDDDNDFNCFTDDDDDESLSSSSSPSSSLLSDATTSKTSQKNIVMSTDWMKLRGLERWTSQVLYHVRQMASQTLRSELYICQSSQRCGCSDCSSCSSSGRPSSRLLSCPLTEQQPYPLHHHVDDNDDIMMATCSCGGGVKDVLSERLAEISRTHSARAVAWARRLAQWDAAAVVAADRNENTARPRPMGVNNNTCNY